MADPRSFNHARNQRMVAAYRAGTPVELLGERFGLSRTQIYNILATLGERVPR